MHDAYASLSSMLCDGPVEIGGLKVAPGAAAPGAKKEKTWEEHWREQIVNWERFRPRGGRPGGERENKNNIDHNA